MGRKPIYKYRKTLTAKMEMWLIDLLPQIQKEDLSSLTIDRIAAITNKSKSTIYEYFSSKDDIIILSISKRIELLDKLPDINKDKPLLDIYFEVINWLIKNLQDISFIFLTQIKTHFPSCWEIIDQFMFKLLSFLKEIYTKGINKNLFTNIPIDLLLALDKFFISEYIANSRKETTLDKLIQAYVNLRLNGLLIKQT